MDYKSITTEELERMIRQMGQKDGEALCELGRALLVWTKWNNGKSNKGRTPV